MDQKILENEDTSQNCNFCTRSFKSSKGLQYHMQKCHPLDLTSGLSCYTCNKTFTKRDLIENHFKTVRHQLECKKLMEEDKVEQNCQNYRKMLMKMNNFMTRPYTERNWNFNKKTPVKIPLESETYLPDPRLQKNRKREFRQLNEEKPETSPEKAARYEEEASSKTTQNLLKESQSDKVMEKATIYSENQVDFNLNGILEPRKEDHLRTKENPTEKTIAAMSSSEGRSTLDSHIPIVSTEDQSEKLETQVLKQIDGIPTKTVDIKPKQDIPEPIKEDRPRSEEIYSENCIATKPSFEGRSTLISSKIPNSLKTIQDPTKIPENPELTQIDGIPSKSDEIHSTFQDSIEESEDKPNFSPGTRSTLKQLPHEDPQDIVEIYLPTSEEDTIDQDLDRFIKEYLETNLKETRTVKLNNEWRITDSIGTPDFPELLKEDPNFDLLTFITDKMPF